VKIAYLINCPEIGGGMEYIRQQMHLHAKDECRIFFSSRGECTVAKVNEWGADEVVVNHLSALVQLLRNPFVRPWGRVIFVVHGIHVRKYEFMAHTPLNLLRYVLRLWLERLLYRRCDLIVTLTRTDAARVRRLYGMRLPVSIVANTLDLSFVAPPESLNYRPDEFAFASIARFDLPKGQDTFINAIALAQDALRDAGCRTLMIGAGPTLAKIRRLATRLGIADIVEFAGEIPNAGIYMTCARVLVAPSRWEGLPYLMLEAVARKRRVIASDCPGNRDVLNGYDKAELFPVEDERALAALLLKHATGPDQ